jgi:GT2 family glycosyltransferase
MGAASAHARTDEGGLSFDLVLATVGRTNELDDFLASLEAQSYKRFRVILVDQNDDDRLEPILERHSNAFPLVRTTSAKGLSRARNEGLQHLEGNAVAFPDDDCLYPPDLLASVARVLREHPQLDGVTGRNIDEEGESSFLLWEKEASPVSRRNVWRTAVSHTIFLRRPVVERVGPFDESLGAGSGTEWGSGEETDYVLRVLSAGFSLRYDPDIRVVHEWPQPDGSPRSAHKAYLTGMGNSRVLRKHGYPLWFAVYRVLQLVVGSAYFLAKGRAGLARYYWAMARGRAVGWVRA